MRTKGAIAAWAAAAGLLVPAAPAAAQSRNLQSIWMIEPAPPPPGVRHLASKEIVLKQRLLPTALAELARPTSESETGATLAEGTQLIEVTNGAGALFCEGDLQGSRQGGKLAGGRAQLCFLDSDGDRRFESWFRSWSSTPALVMISGRMPKALKPLAAPLGYRLVDPTTSRIGAFVAIERRNFFNIYNRESFQIVFGSGDMDKRITAPVQFKSEEMPKEIHILGARFTALSEADGKMAIEVHSAMPAQPFGVVQTVTWR